MECSSNLCGRIYWMKRSPVNPLSETGEKAKMVQKKNMIKCKPFIVIWSTVNHMNLIMIYWRGSLLMYNRTFLIIINQFVYVQFYKILGFGAFRSVAVVFLWKTPIPALFLPAPLSTHITKSLVCRSSPHPRLVSPVNFSSLAFPPHISSTL